MAKIGEADVEVHGDLKPLVKDIEQAKAILKGLDKLKVNVKANVDTSQVAALHSILGKTLLRASNLNKIKFDNFNELAAAAIAADSLANKLGDIFESATKVRKIAIQLGTSLATGFAAAAQATGALISGMGQAVNLGAALAGIGVIAIAVKFLLDDAEVNAALQNVKSTFKNVITESASNLKPILTDFFNTLSDGINQQKPAFDKFFKTVEPGFKRLGQAFNNFVKSDEAASILNRFGIAANNLLTKVANGLQGFILGLDKVFTRLSKAHKEIQDAFGPSFLSGITFDGIVHGIDEIVHVLTLAGPAVIAFKKNFGVAFDAALKSLEGFMATLGKVGPAIFNALGPIAATVATTLGEVGSSFLKLAANVLPKVQTSVQNFITVFGTNFAKSVELLGPPLSAVINGITQLGAQLAPLLPLFSQTLANLEPIVGGFLRLTNAAAPLAVAIGHVIAAFSAGFGPAVGAVLTILSSIASVISTVLTPVLNVLASSGIATVVGALAGLAAIMLTVRISLLAFQTASGGFAARIAEIGALGSAQAAVAAGFSARMAVIGTALFAVKDKIMLAYTAIGVGAIEAQSRIAAAFTGLGPKITAGMDAALVTAALRFPRLTVAATNAANGIGNAFRSVGPRITAGLDAALVTAALRFPQLTVAANSAATGITAAIGRAKVAIAGMAASFAGSRVAAAATAVTVRTIGLAATVASVGVKGLSLAFNLLGGPIGLVLLGIQILISGFKGLVEIGKGVGTILEGIFTLDWGKIKEGFSQVVEGAKHTVSQVASSFGIGGEEAGTAMSDGIADGAAKGSGKVTSSLDAMLSKIKLDAGEAGRVGGTSLVDQFSQQLSTMDVSGQVDFLTKAFADGGLLAGDQFADGANKRLVESLARNFQLPQEMIDSFHESGSLAGSGLKDGFEAKLQELKNIIPQSIGDAEALKALGTQLGGEGGAALVKSAEAAITRLKGGPQAAAADAISPKKGEAEKQGAEAADNMIKTVTEALQKSGPDIQRALEVAFDAGFNTLSVVLGPKISAMMTGAFSNSIMSSIGTLTPQIVASMSLAFDGAFAILPGVLGPKLSNMMNVAFATSIQSSTTTLTPQIVASMSLAFDGAFAILPGVLGPKLSNMMNVAFATSIATSGTTLSPQIVATMSLAFDGAFAILPGVLGPKLSAMIDAVFAGITLNGLALAATLQTVFTGAFGFAFINLPSAAAPYLQTALETTVNLALSGFGLSIQSQITEAFTTGFSGVGPAISNALTSAFAQAAGAVSAFAGQMQQAASDAGQGVIAGLTPLQTQIPEIFRSAFAQAKVEAETGVTNLVAAVKAGVDQINALAPEYQHAGEYIGQALADGMNSKVDAVHQAALNLAAAAAAPMPHSPAKEGPLSGKGDPLHSGRVIVERLVNGMREREPEIRGELDKLLTEFKRLQGAGGTANIGAASNRAISLGGLGGGLTAGAGLQGRFDSSIRGSILKQDTQATVGGAMRGSILQIRPGNINISLQGTNDPRQFINDLSRELMTNCTGR